MLCTSASLGFRCSPGGGAVVGADDSFASADEAGVPALGFSIDIPLNKSATFTLLPPEGAPSLGEVTGGAGCCSVTAR